MWYIERTLHHVSPNLIPSGLHRSWGTWLEPQLLVLCKPAVRFFRHRLRPEWQANLSWDTANHLTNYSVSFVCRTSDGQRMTHIKKYEILNKGFKSRSQCKVSGSGASKPVSSFVINCVLWHLLVVSGILVLSLFSLSFWRPWLHSNHRFTPGSWLWNWTELNWTVSHHVIDVGVLLIESTGIMWSAKLRFYRN